MMSYDDWEFGEPTDAEIIKIADVYYEAMLITIAPDNVEEWFIEKLINSPALLFRYMPGGTRHVIYSNGHTVFDPNTMRATSIKGWEDVITSAMLYHPK